MSKKIGIVCMILGTALVLAALSLLGFNRIEDNRAGKASEAVLTDIQRIIEDKDSCFAESDGEAPSITEMTVVEIDGYGYIGYLSIPALSLELPVMADWSYPQLKIAPCRYYGSAKTDNMIIAGHSYTKHFNNIGTLHPDDEVIFTDMDGVQYVYRTVEIETIYKTDVEGMINSDYDLTLFTCTYSGVSRTAVRCRLAVK